MTEESDPEMASNRQQGDDFKLTTAYNVNVKEGDLVIVCDFKNIVYGPYLFVRYDEDVRFMWHIKANQLNRFELISDDVLRILSALSDAV